MKHGGKIFLDYLFIINTTFTIAVGFLNGNTFTIGIGFLNGNTFTIAIGFLNGKISFKKLRNSYRDSASEKISKEFKKILVS